jgi:hypothetical protein
MHRPSCIVIVIIHRLPFVIHRSSFIIRHPSLIIHRSLSIIRRSSFIVIIVITHRPFIVIIHRS